MSFLSSLGQFKGLLYNEVHIDDVVFRLHYGFTTYALLFMCLLVTGTVYLGEPIHCTLAYKYWHYMIPKPMLNIYCYVHSTFVIPQAGHTDVQNQLYPYPGVGHTRNATGRTLKLAISNIILNFIQTSINYYYHITVFSFFPFNHLQ